MGIFARNIKRLRNVSLALLLLVWQLAFAAVPFLQTSPVLAAPVCVNDTAGANDEPGQKDLNKLCQESSPAAGTEVISWNWDELGTSGNNTMDACALFDDADADVDTDYSVCVITEGAVATLQDLVIYSCGNDKNDRCTSPRTEIAGPYDSVCTVGQTATDPFPGGASAPQDTTANCSFDLSDLGVPNLADLTLTDVCSYPSSQPNSDPSDCVIIQNNPVALIEVIKDVVPNGNTGLFNLTVNGPQNDDTTTVNNLGDGGTTGVIGLQPPNNGGTAVVSETAGTNTVLASYSSFIRCVNRVGGSLVIEGAGTSIQVAVNDGSNIVCTITNTAAGSITIVKDAVPNDTQDFVFSATGTGVTSPFSLDDDSDATLLNTKTFNNLAAGTYTFTEAAAAGWYLDGIDCPNITESPDLVNRAVSLTITAGQNITCTFTNRKHGQIIVTKQTLPDGSATQFGISASPGAGVVGNANQTIADGETETYTVKHGTYAVSETVPAGWTETSNNCANLVIDGNTPLVAGVPTRTCTINNTQLATLNIIKDALPNHEQNFAFTTANLGGAAFSLDDDADNTLSNQQSFTSLLPGSYSVTESATAGWSLTGLSCDTNNFVVNGSSVTANLAAGQTTNCTFTNTKLVSISGTKFTSSATGGLGSVLSGWTIFVDANNNGILDNGELSDVTDGNGDYSFGDLLPGSFVMREVLSNGWTQIFGPDGFTLAAGEDAVDKDFGNFQNGSISGYKWNDLNANSTADQAEPKLSGWTIKLLQSDNNTINGNYVEVGSTVTDANGNYSFTNLSPLPSRFYAVCEVQQVGWIQAFPVANGGCHYIELDQSGETNANTNFGNQGRGNVTVNKNVDTDGDGDIDIIGATDWEWSISENQASFATGSTQNFAAGSYTVTEEQKDNYHVTSASCTGETPPNLASESVTLTLSPGENVVCTFVNTRDTGSLTLVKHVVNDNGGQVVASSFTLHARQNGVDVANSPAAGSETGTVYSLPTGTYTVDENAPVSGYQQTSIICDGQPTSTVSLTTGSQKVCTITNDDIAPQLTVIKNVINDNSGDSDAADFTMNVAAANVSDASFPGNETGTTVTLNVGGYTVTEDMPVGSEYTAVLSADCTGTIALGQTKTCTITNNDVAHPGIQIVKTGPATAHEGDQVTYTFTVTNTGDTTLAGATVVDSLAANATFQSGDTNNNGLLDKTETWIFTVNYLIPAPQVPNVINTAVVCATDPAQTRVCDDDDHELDVLHPAITVVKSGPPLAYEGQIVGYSFLVTNTGDTTLFNVGISDDIATNESCLVNTLAPTASTTCSAIYLIPVPTEDDVTNTVIASGTDSLGQTVTDQDDHTLDVLHPSINIVKTGPATAHEGDLVTYTFTVTNPGDIPLSNNTVVDSLAGNAVFQSGDTNLNGLLEQSETWIFTVGYTIPTPQVANVVNVGTACGLDPLQTQVCDTDDHTLDVLHPSIVVEKFGPATAYEGELVQYTFTVTNNGDALLINVGISDDIAINEVCLTNTLAPGSFTTCTASFTIPTPQVPNVVNTVIASGTDSLGETVTDQDNHDLDVLHPTITVNKVVVPGDGDNGLFNLQIDDVTKVTNVGNGGTTGAVVVTPGSHSVGEVAGTETDLDDYITSISANCDEGVTVSGDDNVTCTITNTRRPTITIIKDAVNDSEQEFDFTGNLGQFSLVDDGEGTENSITFDQLDLGTYTVTEPNVQDWDLTDISCEGGSDVNVNNRNVVIKPAAGENVTCTFTNVQRANITVVKDAQPNDEQDFHFTIEEFEIDLPDLDIVSILEGLDDGFDLDDDEDETLSNSETTSLAPGIYTITEDEVNDWDLDDVDCGDTQWIRNGNEVMVFVSPGAEITCTFTNQKRAEVAVTKYNDLNLNGEFDEGEPTLPGWEFTLEGYEEGCDYEFPGIFEDFSQQDFDCYEEEGDFPLIICDILPWLCSGGYEYFEQQLTGEDGTTTFAGVKPFIQHELSETLQDGWTLSDIDCSGDERGIFEGEEYYVYAQPGETVECFVGNYQDLVLNIEKTNDQDPTPTIAGDTVQYTITVSVPADSGVSYNTIVTDLPPENFDYQTGSFTASLTTRNEDLRPEDSNIAVGEPTYASPGRWSIGTLFPGEVVTLTYVTKIASFVTPGLYPDIAFVDGQTSPTGSRVLGNVQVASTPFVGSQVSILVTPPVGQVLGASILVNTGNPVSLQYILVPITMITLAGALLRRQKKGGL